MLGSWQHKDTTNSHTWEFDSSTGIWHNITTGHQWQYSDVSPAVWTDNFDGTTWAYDENARTWTQTLTESE